MCGCRRQILKQRKFRLKLLLVRDWATMVMNSQVLHRNYIPNNKQRLPELARKYENDQHLFMLMVCPLKPQQVPCCWLMFRFQAGHRSFRPSNMSLRLQQYRKHGYDLLQQIENQSRP